MHRKKLRSAAGCIALAVVMALSAGCGGNGVDSTQKVPEKTKEQLDKERGRLELDFTVNLSKYTKKVIPAKTSVHDPSIIRAEDGTYYIFGSHMESAKSTDLRMWDRLGNGYQPTNRVYGNLFDGHTDVFAYAGNNDSLIPTDENGGVRLWAPDVIYNKAMGKYCLYYCVTSTFCTSNLCFGISDSIEGPYEWEAPLIYSGFDMNTISGTDVLEFVDKEYAGDTYVTVGGEYDFRSWPNAIDPSVFYDGDGRLWMVYGSWSGGIFLLELDEKTGKVIHPAADPENNVDPYFGKRLLGGGHKSIEGPYILWDEASGYYYLFVSYGSLTADGGYQIRVFRSDTVDGTYVDMEGKYPDGGVGAHSYRGLKLSGNYNLPSISKPYKATGHNSAMVDEDGKRYIVYHTRFADSGEVHYPRVKQFFVNEEGWPCMLPYATDGETIAEKGYTKDEVVGRYYMVDQGMAINADVAQPIVLYLTDKGSVFGENVEGTWAMSKGSPYMHIKIGDVEYSGVFCEMNDEGGTPVMTFTAVGANTSIWGVKYEE